MKAINNKILLAFFAAMLILSTVSPLLASYTIKQPTVLKVEPPFNEFGNPAGDPIPPYTRFTVTTTFYNVADFYGYGIIFVWNTTYLAYVSHTVHAAWTIKVKEEVRPAVGEFEAAFAKLLEPPASGNIPIFSITLEIIKQPYIFETGNPEAIDPIDTLLYFTMHDLSDSKGFPIQHTVEPATVRIWEQRPLPIIKVEPPFGEFGNPEGDHISPGTQFTLKVNIINVTGLYGFDLKFEWNTTYLSYVTHYIHVPKNWHPDGLLWRPHRIIYEEVNSAAGTYRINCTSLDPAPSFNGSGIAFSIKLEIIKQPYYNETGDPNAIDFVDVNLNLTYTKLINKAGEPLDHSVENATIRIWEKRWLPIVRVEPEIIEYTENVIGDTFTVAVKIIGVEVLYGFEINFTWDPTYLEYLDHQATVPVENFTGGVLHFPVIEIKNNVSATEGLYRIVFASMFPAPPFNGTGTVFNITFRIKYQPLEPEPTVQIPLTLKAVELASFYVPPGYSEPIEHVKEHGLVILRQRSFEPKPTIKVQPPKTVISGTNFQINITIENLHRWWELLGFDVKLSFNQSSLEAIEIIEGPFLQQFGTTVLVLNITNNDEGFVQIAVALLGSEDIPEGSGVLATITFQTLEGASFSTLNLYETELAANVNETKWKVPWSMPIPHTAVDGIFVVDATAPIVEITYPREGSYIKNIWINGTVREENMNGLRPSINDTRFTLVYWDETTGSFSFSNNTHIPDGLLSITVNFTDMAGNTGEDTVTFTVDATAPIIEEVTQAPPPENVQPTDIVKINVTAVDQIGIGRVTLLYSTNNGTTWQSIMMTPLEGNIYSATIPAQPYCTHVWYYVEVEDFAGNTAVSPVTNYYTYHVIPEFPSIIVLAMLTSLALLLSTFIKFKAAKHLNTSCILK